MNLSFREIGKLEHLCKSEKVRIAFLMTSLDGGGSQRQMYNLVNSLRGEYLPEVYYCTQGVYLSRLKEIGIPTHCLRPRYKVKGLNTLMILMVFMQVLRSSNPNIIHSYLIRANIIAVLASIALKIPVILDERGFSYGVGTVILKIRKLIYRYADKVICNSQAILQELTEKNIVRTNYCTVINNSVCIPKQIKVERECTSILCVSALRYVKGVDVLIRAYAIIISQNPELAIHWRLCIAGSGKEAERLYAMAVDHKVDGSVDFLGWVDDPIELYKRSAIFVLPSRSEGTSNSLLEAMSFRIAPIVTDVGGNPYLVENDVNGLLVQAESHTKLAEAIYSLITQPQIRKRLARSAYEFVSINYSSEENRKKYVREYEKVLKK